MITGTVSSAKIRESKRLDAEFHLRGRRLKAVCTRRSYAVELTSDEMAAIRDRDKENKRAGVDTLLWVIGRMTAVYCVDYDAQLGTKVFFTINAVDDKPGLRQRVVDAVRAYIGT